MVKVEDYMIMLVPACPANGPAVIAGGNGGFEAHYWTSSYLNSSGLFQSGNGFGQNDARNFTDATAHHLQLCLSGHGGRRHSSGRLVMDVLHGLQCHEAGQPLHLLLPRRFIA